MTRERPTPACAGKSDLFERIDAASHNEARTLCLGRDGSPARPLLEACGEWLRGERGRKGTPEGTWAGQLLDPDRAARERQKQRRGNPREHGTDGGYYQHRNRKERACFDCCEGMRIATNARRGVAS